MIQKLKISKNKVLGAKRIMPFLPKIFSIKSPIIESNMLVFYMFPSIEICLYTILKLFLLNSSL